MCACVGKQMVDDLVDIVSDLDEDVFHVVYGDNICADYHVTHIGDAHRVRATMKDVDHNGELLKEVDMIIYKHNRYIQKSNNIQQQTSNL